MGKEVIFIADDFGLNAGINQAILHAHLKGSLHGAALMMGQVGTEEAVTLARHHPGLQIGWHLHLNDSQPATCSAWPWGSSPVRAGWSIGLFPSARRLMREEVARQWELFQTTGLPCHFINSHHHLHTHPFIYTELRKTIRNHFHGWLRLGKPRAFSRQIFTQLNYSAAEVVMKRRRRLSEWNSSDTLWGMDRTFHMQSHEIRQAVKNLGAGRHEFIFHPRSLVCDDTKCLLELKNGADV